MIGLMSLRWLLTAVFAAAAIFHLARWVRPQVTGRTASEVHRTSELLHLVMCVSMIAMVWPWGTRVPGTVWVGVFTVSTGWFVAQAARSHGRRAAPAFFATAAAAMVWMSAAPAHAAPPGGHHDMVMATASHAPSGYLAWISAGLGGYLMLAAIWWVIRGMRLAGLATTPPPDHSPNWSALCHGSMSAGMALALLAMA